MAVNIEIFCIIAAVVIVATRLILNFMEDKDRAKGMAVNHKEYTMSYIAQEILRDNWKKIKTFVLKKIFRQTDEQIQERENRKKQKRKKPKYKSGTRKKNR